MVLTHVPIYEVMAKLTKILETHSLQTTVTLGHLLHLMAIVTHVQLKLVLNVVVAPPPLQTPVKTYAEMATPTKQMLIHCLQTTATSAPM